VIKFVSDLRHATNTTDRHDITEILLNAIKQTTVFFTTTYSSLISPCMTYHRVSNKSNATGTTHGTETVYSSGAHGFTSVLVASVLLIFFLGFFVVLRICYLFVCLFVCFFCVGGLLCLSFFCILYAQCCQCL